jgi:hypothetical protein
MGKQQSNNIDKRMARISCSIGPSIQHPRFENVNFIRQSIYRSCLFYNPTLVTYIRKTKLHDSRDVNFAGVNNAIDDERNYYESNNKIETSETSDEINPNDIGETLQPTTKTKHVTFKDDLIDDESNEEDINNDEFYHEE